VTTGTGVSAAVALPRIALAEPTLNGNEARYLQECIDTNFVSSVGPFVERFEREFAAFVGARHAVAVASGTAAIHLAIRALDIADGAEVFVSDLTFIASANPITYERAIPVLVDSERTTLNLDPARVIDELERRDRAGRRQPAAIEVVHLLGHPADLEPIQEAADRYRIPVIEDASEALGATWTAGRLAGRQVGSVGAIGCFSFNGNKIMTTGNGGMVVTDDPEIARRVRHLSTQARLPGRAYDHDEVGYNYRLSNIAAAVGVAQLEQLPDLLARRRALAGRYDRAIASIPGLGPAARAPWAEPSFWLYTAHLDRDAGLTRDELLDGLAVVGIEGRPIWTPLHRIELLADAPRLGHETADAIFEGGVSLPSSSSLPIEAQERVVDAIRARLGAAPGA
jgi:dTDP-4-amino-4,6-dideoxygalactose transaminase